MIRDNPDQSDLAIDLSITAIITLIALSPLTSVGRSLHTALPIEIGLPLFYLSPIIMLVSWFQAWKNVYNYKNQTSETSDSTTGEAE